MALSEGWVRAYDGGGPGATLRKRDVSSDSMATTRGACG